MHSPRFGRAHEEFEPHPVGDMMLASKAWSNSIEYWQCEADRNGAVKVKACTAVSQCAQYGIHIEDPSTAWWPADTSRPEF